MVLIQAVDLASRYSASCTIDGTGVVLDQFDSWRCTQQEFIGKVVEPFNHEDFFSEIPLVLGIEDLPHGVKFMTLVKNVCRLQGRIIERMEWWERPELLLFIPPILWQRATPGVWRQGPDAVIPVAKDLYGYEPPDLGLAELHGKDRVTARKVRTDYASAYLIARWLLDQYNKTGVFDATTTSRHESW